MALLKANGKYYYRYREGPKDIRVTLKGIVLKNEAVRIERAVTLAVELRDFTHLNHDELVVAKKVFKGHGWDLPVDTVDACKHSVTRGRGRGVSCLWSARNLLAFGSRTLYRDGQGTLMWGCKICRRTTVRSVYTSNVGLMS